MASYTKIRKDFIIWFSEVYCHVLVLVPDKIS